MIGSVKGCVSLIHQENPDIIRTHCFLHREVLVSKGLPIELKEVLDSVIEMINYIKSRLLKCRLFEKICTDMDSSYKKLLLHTEVRWLSKGKVLLRVYQLRKELREFFNDELQAQFCNYLSCEVWINKLAYLTEIFGCLNNLNSSMQGRSENILTSSDKLVAFQKKLNLWKNRVNTGNLEMFPLLQISNSEEMKNIIFKHLCILENDMDFYFPSLKTESYDWIRNPFVPSSNNLSLKAEEELMAISCDRTLRLKYSEITIDSFWISVQQEYPVISEIAVSILLQFSTSYLCELGFSTLNNIKTKKRERLLGIEEEMRVSLSELRPNIEKVAKKNQAQISH